MESIEFLDIANGQLADLSATPHPCKVFSWNTSIELAQQNSTYFGIAFEGETDIDIGTIQATIPTGGYFATNHRVSLKGGSGMVIEMLNYVGLPMVGGPIESKGRLRYIDGCTDTLLIAPPKLGDPCLNLLHFTKGIKQSAHSHPSVRVGIVMSGKGICHTPSSNLDLIPGKIFYMLANTVHGFETQDEEMVVVAWHPDSDTGPSDNDHPMVNRTIVDGVSANKINAIRTKGLD
jgi:quercetin dioxygenase-like cupin family protein